MSWSGTFLPASIVIMSVLFNQKSFSLDDDERPLIVGISVLFICLSEAAVLFRFLARRISQLPLMWDDWMIVIALILAWAFSIVTVLGTVANSDAKKNIS